MAMKGVLLAAARVGLSLARVGLSLARVGGSNLLGSNATRTLYVLAASPQIVRTYTSSSTLHAAAKGEMNFFLCSYVHSLVVFLPSSPLSLSLSL